MVRNKGLRVIVQCDADQWVYEIVNDDDGIVQSGRTHVVDLDMYDCNTAEEYILTWCF